VSSRRSIAFSRTMRAYWRTLPTRGTEPASRSTVAAAADGVELAGLLEVLDERQRVHGLAGAVELEHRRKIARGSRGRSPRPAGARR
jgi:hypothetical protein